MSIQPTEDFIKFKRGIGKLKSQTDIKICFYKAHNCDLDIIRAHSIQNNRYLTRISQHGIVLGVSFVDGMYNFDEIGRNSASIFRGFCKTHDSLLFKDIEESDLIIGNVQQYFLFAYRALAKEYLAKLNQVTIWEKLISLYEQDDKASLSELFSNEELPGYEIAKEYVSIFLKPNCNGARLTKNYLESLRAYFNKSLRKGDYSIVTTEIVELSSEYPIVCSSCFFIEEDIDGNAVNSLFVPKPIYKPTFMTIIPQNGKTFILLSFLTNKCKDFEFFQSQLKSKSEDVQKGIISCIIASYVENFFISPSYKYFMDESFKKQFSQVFHETIYSKKIRISDRQDINLFRRLNQ